MIKIKGKICNKPHIYKITNDINGKFYYGVHNGKQTKKYKGSSNLLKAAYKKYGEEKFTKEILLWFDTVKEAYEYEEVIIDQKMVDNPHCYNLRLGGNGANELSGPRLQQWKKDNPEEWAKVQSANASKAGKIAIADRDLFIERVAKAGGRATAAKRTKEDYLRINRKAVANSMQNGTHMSKQRKSCIHCGFESTPGNITRWHNSNCKHRDDNTSKKKE